MQAAADGWFSLHVPEVRPGTEYGFVAADGSFFPDPASRRQAADVHGPSLVVDPEAYEWRSRWTGRPWEEAVIYELHVGTFTPEGTFASAREKLPELAETGITAIEIMPVAQFAGDRGWGYDGVLPYAPHPAYGSPDEMKSFVDAAHEQGLMVLLDVVYNHFGPEGNYLGAYADFFDEERHTPWGAAIAYSRPPVRRFFIENALYWLTEFRLDGLRLDAIDHIRDDDEPEILVELARTVRARITDRPVHLTTEDNRNITRLHERGANGDVPLYTAEWNDDFHNVAHVIASGESEGYYADFTGDHWRLLARSLAEGFAYQGEPSRYGGGQPRGVASAHLPPTAFVDFLQNHDQTGNRAFGERLIALSYREMMEAMTAILLLSPHIPLLFMGEEYGERRPFCFFTDFHGELAEAVRDGRRREFAHFAAFAGDTHELSHIPDPNAPSTFEASKLDWDFAAGPEGREARAKLRHLLALRREHILPHLAGTSGHSADTVACNDGAIAIDWRLNGATLALRANLSDAPRPLPAARGREIFASFDGGLTPAAPFRVAVFLERDAE